MLSVVKIKGCRRCRGDVFLERDSEGEYISCLQCGAVYTKHDKEEKKISRNYRLIRELAGITTGVGNDTVKAGNLALLF